jgi:hypothetical protein
MKRWLTVALTAILALGVRADEPPPKTVTEVFGTIVSVRGGILQVRPSLRPRLTRISVSERTQVFVYRPTDRAFLKPGMRAQGGAAYNEKDKTLRPFWIEASAQPLGPLQEKLVLRPEGDFARYGGTIKSVDPLVVTDDEGADWTLSTERLNGYYELLPGDRNALLIGTRLVARGTMAPDGVLQADSVAPDRDYAALGTMFGTILKVQGRVLTIRPRYTHDTLVATLDDAAVLLGETRIAPETIRIGDSLTVWGQRLPGKKELAALALLQGDGRYPSATGENAPVYISGRLASLEPTVTLKAADGTRIPILIPAQLPIARLSRIAVSGLRSGAPAMIVLHRETSGNAWRASAVIVDASPWVGYGG